MATPRTVALHTLGCKLNYSETSSLARLFEQKGYGILPFDKSADVYVINTCSVTDFADQKCRQYVRRALRKNPHARVIVTGCYAQLKPAEIAAIPGVDLVLGAAEKFRITEYLEQITSGAAGAHVFAGDIRSANVFTSSFSFGDRTRSFLKVQDGCDYKCTFCTIPLARGASRSDTIENVVAQARALGQAGAREIVLTGVNIGDFGKGTAVIEGVRPKKEALFIDLIRALDQVEEVARFRISSIEPNLCTREIIEFVATSKRFMPHFHMPLQSGNNHQLRMMKRRYTSELYAERVAWIKEIMPHACIGVDIITGFPGESDADFEASFSFIHALPVSYLHVFTYSERPNTPAIELPNPVAMHVRRDRNNRLRMLSEKKRHAFYAAHVGTIRAVLIEKDADPDWLTGFTDNYIQVRLPSSAAAVNQMANARLQALLEDMRCEAIIEP
jgi:threonylcarbamoyladenosine tRNA methylthiotransferase MtaB